MTTADNNVIQAHCPQCGGDRAVDVIGEHSVVTNSDHYDSETIYRIIKCRGCAHVQFQTAFTDTEDVDYSYAPNGDTVMEHVETIRYFPPKPKRLRPEWTRPHSGLHSRATMKLLDEAYEALGSDLHVVSAIACRTVFDAATERLSINPDLSFKQKLDELVQKGKIDSKQRDILQVLTDAGSAAAHRGWVPTDEELDTMFTIMEDFLHRAFVIAARQAALEKRADALKQRTPPRHTS